MLLPLMVVCCTNSWPWFNVKTQEYGYMMAEKYQTHNHAAKHLQQYSVSFKVLLYERQNKVGIVSSMKLSVSMLSESKVQIHSWRSVWHSRLKVCPVCPPTRLGYKTVNLNFKQFEISRTIEDLIIRLKSREIISSEIEDIFNFQISKTYLCLIDKNIFWLLSPFNVLRRPDNFSS